MPRLPLLTPPRQTIAGDSGNEHDRTAELLHDEESRKGRRQYMGES
jgi:hypothetical protein